MRKLLLALAVMTMGAVAGQGAHAAVYPGPVPGLDRAAAVHTVDWHHRRHEEVRHHDDHHRDRHHDY